MKTPPRCKLPAILGAVVAAALLAACGDNAPPQEPAASESTTTTEPATTEPASGSTQAADNPCPDPPPCGEDCSNHPFAPTDCWTTPYGPAKADVILAAGNPLTSTNFLYCEGGAYALCFFSGPPDPTGTNPDNRPLPCVLQGDVAKCTCQAYTSGPYFVDINAILNLGAFYETVQACGQDGSGCANIANCGPDGKKPGCKERKPAPVCQYVRDQNPDDSSVSLMPRADLVSTFSFAMDGDYRIGSTPCDGLYAGCMTAPCFFAEGHGPEITDGEPIQCECPTYTGTYQVGQSRQSCSISSSDGASYVWSAANTVSTGGGS